MRKRQMPPPLPEYLRSEIQRRGFQTVSDFARAANINQSVISRWLSGETRPVIPLLERIAPVLQLRLSTLVRLAYPEIDEGLPIVDEEGRQVHPLAAEMDRLLGPNSALSDQDRDTLERLIDSVLSPFRRIARRRVS